MPVSLFYPIWQSVARRSRYTKDIIGPAERLSREEALRAIAAELTMVGGRIVYERKPGEDPAAVLAGL